MGAIGLPCLSSFVCPSPDVIRINALWQGSSNQEGSSQRRQTLLSKSVKVLAGPDFSVTVHSDLDVTVDQHPHLKKFTQG